MSKENNNTNSINQMSPLEEHIVQNLQLSKCTKNRFDKYSDYMKGLLLASSGKSNTEHLFDWITSENPRFLLKLTTSDKLSHIESIELMDQFHSHLNELHIDLTGAKYNDYARLFVFADSSLLGESHTSIGPIHFDALLCDPLFSLTDTESLKQAINDAIMVSLESIESWKGIIEINEIIDFSIHDFDLEIWDYDHNFDLKTSVEYECVGYPSEKGLNFHLPLNNQVD